ncbi:hypothetical protein [Streptomyces coeruleorubidus]|uniref:hypothetical protein n=1 Tax=Streptomyces coeruleorubidus TaxID=116188 RepID=UPI0033CAE992
MFGLAVGTAMIVFGVLLIGDFGKAATRIYDFFASFMDPGRATAGTFRLVGVFAILVGAVWAVTSLPLG